MIFVVYARPLLSLGKKMEYVQAHGMNGVPVIVPMV